VTHSHLIWMIQGVTLNHLRYQARCFFVSFSVLLFISCDHVSKGGFIGNKVEKTNVEFW
jgi:hypothetical protein